MLRRAVINISSNLGSSLENYQALHRKQTVIPQYCLDYRASKAALNACAPLLWVATWLLHTQLPASNPMLAQAVL